MAAKAGVTSIGGGEQNVPWIHVEDAARAVVALCEAKNRSKMQVHFAKQLETPNLFMKEKDDTTSPQAKSLGFSQQCFPVNIAAPLPLAQKDLFKAIHADQQAKRLWKLPAAIPVPPVLFAKAFGPGASVFLDSVYSPPTALVESGAFTTQEFRYADIESALSSWDCSLPVAK